MPAPAPETGGRTGQESAIEVSDSPFSFISLRFGLSLFFGGFVVFSPVLVLSTLREKSGWVYHSIAQAHGQGKQDTATVWSDGSSFHGDRGRISLVSHD